ncbi:hypothetical protein [Nitrogeniibacter aestuarii]|uniref:hypothetical protein n=1 Tax=Nitrogeniibacter aestuarii TaxID=2815343 RepID=UPI001E3F6A58|nr:hypothetical protein [Nitrogeniibacter aestuarii]
MSSFTPRSSSTPSLVGQADTSSDDVSNVSILGSLDSRQRRTRSGRLRKPLLVMGVASAALALLAFQLAPEFTDLTVASDLQESPEVVAITEPVPPVTDAVVTTAVPVEIETTLVEQAPEAALIRDVAPQAPATSVESMLSADPVEHQDAGVVESVVQPPEEVQLGANSDPVVSPPAVAPKPKKQAKAVAKSQAPRREVAPDADVDIITAIVRSAGR